MEDYCQNGPCVFAPFCRRSERFEIRMDGRFVEKFLKVCRVLGVGFSDQILRNLGEKVREKQREEGREPCFTQ